MTRIIQENYVAGRWYLNDIGNAQNGGAEDVYSIRNLNGVWEKKFAYAFQPQTQTQFGLYGPMGNNLGYRVMPRMEPAVTPSLEPSGTSGDSEVKCQFDPQRVVARDKASAMFSSRSGLIKHNDTNTSNGQRIFLSVGDTVTYRLDSSSDQSRTWTVPAFGGVTTDPGTLESTDAAQAIAARQRSWDDSLVPGELYKIGEAVGILIQRDQNPFVSEADTTTDGVNSVEAIFRITRPGVAQFTELNVITAPANKGAPFLNGTQGCHLFRCAIANFVIDRPARHIEIALKSTLRVNYNGMMNWREARGFGDGGIGSDNELDYNACWKYNGIVIPSGSTFSPVNYVSGTYTGNDTRYSFFKIGYRIAGDPDTPYTYLKKAFGIRSATGEPVYNYLAIEFPTAERWQIEIVPLTSWQIRYDYGVDTLCVLDTKRTTNVPVETLPDGVKIRYNGDQTVAGHEPGSGGIPPDGAAWFNLGPTNCGDLGLLSRDIDGPYDGYVDAWGKLAEMFWYEEITSSVGGAPEHEVTAVNVMDCTGIEPSYENMALLGLNLRASTEANQLGQISVYVTKGQGSETVGTHLFPECLEILLTNPRFGAGAVLPSAMIDSASFASAAAWTEGRRYFFDVGLSQPINLISQANEWAQYFLLDLGRAGGKFTLKPTANFVEDGPYDITAMFTYGNTLSFELNYAPMEERTPPIVNVKWRYENQVSTDDGSGIFPVLRQVTVREATTPEDARFITVDMSEFCTSEIHAIDYAKMLCRKARLVDHTVSSKVYPDVATASPGAIVKYGMETLTYSQPKNGVILHDGTILQNGAPLADGSYTAVIWTGQGTNIQEVTLSVTDRKEATYRNAVFCLCDLNAHENIYKIEAVDFDEDGNVDIVASVFPLDNLCYSLLTKDWDTGWVIEGSLADESCSPGPPDPPVGCDRTCPPEGTTFSYLIEIEVPSGSGTWVLVDSGTGIITYDGYSVFYATSADPDAPSWSMQFNGCTVTITTFGGGGGATFLPASRFTISNLSGFPLTLVETSAGYVDPPALTYTSSSLFVETPTFSSADPTYVVILDLYCSGDTLP